MKNYIAIAIAAFTLASCGGGSAENKQEETTPAVTEKACTFSYNNESTEVYWTAYKHTAKNPVGGQFDKFETVAEKATAESAIDLLSALSMTIDASTINSGDTARDKKLLAFFFDVMTNTETISGKVKSITETGGILSMTMNEVEQDVDFKYKVGDDNKVELKAIIDVLQFQGESALESLGKACEAKHTGGDGEVKLWSEVSIYITTELVKNCE